MLYKRAGILDAIVEFPAKAIDTGLNIATPAAAIILAAAGMTGTGLGYAMAKATEKRKPDLDIAQRSYMNQRLGADIKQTKAKLSQEYRNQQQIQNLDAPSSLRF